jgi:hypothetical protein
MLHNSLAYRFQVSGMKDSRKRKIIVLGAYRLRAGRLASSMCTCIIFYGNWKYRMNYLLERDHSVDALPHPICTCSTGPVLLISISLSSHRYLLLRL